MENRSPIINNRSVDPRNSNNPLDELGEWLVNGLEYVNEFEHYNINGSTARQQYLEKFQEFQANNPVNINAISSTLSSEFRRQLHLLIKQISKNGEFEESIENIKIIEHAIANTTILSESQKNAHYLFTSTLKFMRYFLANNDIYVNGLPRPIEMKDWEDYYSECLLAALGDWENHPFSTALNWTSFPAVVAGCVADATWQEYWDED